MLDLGCARGSVVLQRLRSSSRKDILRIAKRVNYLSGSWRLALRLLAYYLFVSLVSEFPRMA